MRGGPLYAEYLGELVGIEGNAARIYFATSPPC